MGAQVHTFAGNPFMENTYIVFDETKDCVIIDPGCYTAAEKKNLSKFIEEHNLRPVHLLNTHCHIDHVFGNKYISERYGLPLAIHKGEIPVLESVPHIAQAYGIPNVEISPDPTIFLKEGDHVTFGNTVLDVLFTPGHSPASICFYSKKDAFVIAGDVLFEGSIGRTDLPGGDYDTLINSVRQQLFVLPDNVRVYPGHGNSTTVGKEKRSNPFFVR